MTFYTVFFILSLWHNCRGWYNMIKEYRIKNNYTQEQLALYTDRSFEFIRRIESDRGRRGFSVETLWRISIVLDVPLDAFFKEEEKQEVTNK